MKKKKIISVFLAILMLVSSVTVGVVVYAETRTQEVAVDYVDQNGNVLGRSTAVVDEGAYNINSSAFTDVPEGYELVNAGDYRIGYGVVVELRSATTKVIGVNYWDEENGKQAGEGEVTVDADAWNVNSSELTDIPEGYELTVVGDFAINDGWIFVSVRPVVTTKTVGVNYWDVENGKQVCEGEVTVDADATNVNTSALTDIPEGYELVSVGDISINDGWIYVEVRPVVTTQTVGVNYWDVENSKQAGEGEVTVDADATNVNTSALTDVPEGYELAETGDIAIHDGWIFVSVRPVVTTKTVGVNYWDVENSKQAGEGEVTVDADATNVNTSALTDIPEGYELATVGDVTINDGWIYVEVRPVAAMQTVGVNYWDVENGKQAGEGKIMVDADATNVNTSALTDVPEGYELAAIGDVTINDGWIFVDVRPVATEESTSMAAKANQLLAYSADGVNAGKTVTVIYYIPGEGRYVLGESVTVAEDEINVNTTTLTDIPQGYELVNLGDVRIGYEVVAEVRPITTQTVGVNYWDVENDKQVCEGEVTVDVDAWNVNSSALTDIPAGYELVSVGDFAINDGWIWVEVRPVATTKTVGVNYWDVENDKQVCEGEVTVDVDAWNVNSSALTDIPAGYELVSVGDFAINDGWIWVEVRPAATTQTVSIIYWDKDNDVQVGEGVVTVDADATNVNSSALTDIPAGYELAEVGDYLIEDGTVTVPVRATTPAGLLGDVDANGVVDASDAMQILQYDAHLIELTDAQLAVADVDANGVVDASDAMRILQYDAHIIPSL